MAILAQMQSAAMQLIGRKPGTFFGSPNQFEAEIADLISEVAEDIARYQDWQALIRTHTVTGTGVDASFPFPPDYSRMLQSSAMHDLNNWAWGFGHVPGVDAFIAARETGWGPFPGIWSIYGNQFHFAPVPASGATATFTYISKNWAHPTTGADRDAFSSDTDEYLLPERLLKLGLIWRWRENKKLDATGDQEAFVKALDEDAAKDRGSIVIRRRSRNSFPGTYPAWSGRIG